MALSARYLADRSALTRFTHAAVAARLRPLVEDGLIATGAIVDLEVLYSARSLDDYEAVLEERRSFDSAPITPEVIATAVDLQHALAQRGQHRVPIPDLVISAAAPTKSGLPNEEPSEHSPTTRQRWGAPFVGSGHLAASTGRPRTTAPAPHER